MTRINNLKVSVLVFISAYRNAYESECFVFSFITLKRSLLKLQSAIDESQTTTNES